jgi:hypothetical protein
MIRFDPHVIGASLVAEIAHKEMHAMPFRLLRFESDDPMSHWPMRVAGKDSTSYRHLPMSSKPCFSCISLITFLPILVVIGAASERLGRQTCVLKMPRGLGVLRPGPLSRGPATPEFLRKLD